MKNRATIETLVPPTTYAKNQHPEKSLSISLRLILSAGLHAPAALGGESLARFAGFALPSDSVYSSCF